MGLSSASPWLKFYGNTPASLDYPRKTMCQMVLDTAKRYPDHTAYIFMGKKTSYSQFAKRIDAAARGLYAMGIRKGDKVTCGQTIALVGSTGNVTGSHLHLTLEKDNIRLDPAYYVDL